MARGFLAGAIWGVVFSGAGLSAISLNSPLPEKAAMVPPPGGPVDSSLLKDTDEPKPVAAAKPDPEPDPDLSQPLVVETSKDDATPAPKPDLSKPGLRPQPETGVDRPVAPAGAPVVPTAPVAVGADTAPLAAPLIGEAPVAPGGGSTDPINLARPAGGDAPVRPGGQGPAPGAPAPGAKPVIVTGPAQPPAPLVPESATALLPEATDTAPVIGPDDPAPVAEAKPVAEFSEPLDPAPAPTVTARAPTKPDPAPRAPAAPRIGKPATSLVDRGRVDTPDPEEEVPEEPPVQVLAGVAPESPLSLFASKAEVAEDVPRMAVVLIDDGSGPIGPEAVKAFPFPVSFAVSPSHPKAAEAAKGYRDLGFEVLVLGDLPDGAQAADVEVALQGLMRAVPEAIAVIEDPDGSLQENREVSAQVSAFLRASGHGLVMQPKGLNTAQKLALKDGVPSVTLFRDFDGEDQDAAMIRRTLDNAVVRARQVGGVVMLGRLRADTISALVLWGLQDRSDTIALAPVSVVLAESLENE